MFLSATFFMDILPEAFSIVISLQNRCGKHFLAVSPLAAIKTAPEQPMKPIQLLQFLTDSQYEKHSFWVNVMQKSLFS